ncbi:hypothetical protein QOZ88_19165 [Blastococcus sp. BMG 814]|uniref:Uncharacterized protein n=1 Tax=Blastococcus carthaginiensis TaxID=3050034 RepID=A0ABT9IGP4_9ACTN|nr:hypothetical protein [Blastococcus carthaginiensis]MDP5184760.1 hypothetical protein [Blastococcus carthaginiensis]
MPRPLARLAVATSLALSPLGLAACGDDAAPEPVSAPLGDSPEEDEGLGDTEVESGPTYEGLYDTGVYDLLDEYLGEEVVLSAGVEAVLGPQAFVIAGAADSGVPPLLVLASEGVEGLEPETDVEVAGTVQGSFSTTAAEADLGVDLDDELLAPFESEPYLVADSVGEVIAGG